MRESNITHEFGSLKYLTSKFTCNLFSISNNEAKDLEIKLEKLIISVKKLVYFIYSSIHRSKLHWPVCIGN